MEAKIVKKGLLSCGSKEAEIVVNWVAVLFKFVGELEGKIRMNGVVDL